jgi:membrane protein DedA with SNARE-associated domain/rhodanese-related sulfurtransferase
MRMGWRGAEQGEALVTASSQLTYTGVLAAVFANQICLPVPSVVFLMAAGALSAHGEMRASIIVVLGVSACLVADNIWFWLGRRWGSQAMRVLCRFTGDPRRFSHNAHEKFRRYGLPVLCVAKFFPGLDGLLPPLVGAEGAPVAAFLALDTLGAFLWSSFYTGLGYVFSNQLDTAIGWTKQFGTVLAITVGIPLALYASWRGLALLRMIHRLQLRRISPAMLARKLKSNSKLAVLDLLNFEEETDSESLESIPGAVRIDPSRLRKSPHINVPDDVEIILYSSSGGQTLSARAAMALKRIGVDNVWVLEGGLKGWRDKGFPVSQSPEVPEAVAGRLGIKLPEPAG